MASLDRRFHDQGLRVIGLHAPEFDTEKDPENVRRQVRSLKVFYPVVIDNDLRMWNSLGTQYWPTVYLVDRQGSIRHIHIGELHENTPEALEFERYLADILAEPA